MGFIGRSQIGEIITWTEVTHGPTGDLTDADSLPTYRVYERETGTPVLTGTMTKLDDGNTVGLYSEEITLSVISGFEQGKYYNIVVSATVGGITGGVTHGFFIESTSAIQDWTDDERKQIRHRIGIGGDTLVPSGTPSLALKTDVTTVGTAISALNNLSQAQAQAAAAAALVAYGPAVPADIPTEGEIAVYLLSSDVESGGYSANEVGGKLMAAGNAGDPWSVTLPGSYSSQQAGSIVGNMVNNTINGVWSKSSRTITNPIPTAAETRDAILNRLLSAHNEPGSVGAKLNAIVSDVMARTPASYAAGTLGGLIGSGANDSANAVWAEVIGGGGETASDILSGVGAEFTAVPAAVWGHTIGVGVTEGIAGDKLAGISAIPGIGGSLHIVAPTVTEADSTPIQGATIMVTQNSDGSGIITSAATDNSGKVYLMLGEGTYYLWVQKVGYQGNNPITLTVPE